MTASVSAPSPARSLWKRLKKQRLAIPSLIVCLMFFFLAVGTEIYSGYCKSTGIEPVYDRAAPEEMNAPPSRKHWLGTDFLGRDVLTRALFGAKSAVKVGVIASLISASIGVLIGICAGYFGGKTDDFAVWVYSTFASMPTLLFILAFTLLVSKGFLFSPLEKFFAFLAACLHAEPGMLAVYLGIGLTGWVELCRVTRAETMKLREMPFVQAARALGVSNAGILFRHILPNLFHFVIVYFTLRFAYAVMTEVIVSFFGLGAQVEPSWGVMISEGQSQLWRGVWWEAGAATFFLFLLVLALNLLGDALRDAFDPKLNP